MKKRIISMILVLSFVSALFVVPASAAYSYSKDTMARDHWSSQFSAYTIDAWAFEQIKKLDIFGFSDGTSHSDIAWSMLDWVAIKCNSTYGYFGKVDYSTLSSICSQLTNNFVKWDGSALAYYIDTRPFRSTYASEFDYFRHRNSSVWQEFFGRDSRPEFHVTLDAQFGVYRIWLDVVQVSTGELIFGDFFTNSSGDYWYAEAESDSSTPDVSPDPETHTNGLVWIPRAEALDIYRTSNFLCNADEFKQFAAQGKTLLSNNIDVYGGFLESDNPYYAILNSSGGVLAYRFYYGSEIVDRVFLTPSGNVDLYSGTEQTVSENTGNGTVNLNLGDLFMLDALNKFVVSPDGDILFIDNVSFDMSNKTYKFSTTNNYYYFDNRQWHYTYNYSWTYHINYTSITYIGQSEEYDKTYEFYYELPDGRSSADLTAEELEQLNLSIDVLNYGRSADDTRLRSLYHFDGTTDDSSYWNYATSFTWNKGASLTYMESGNFNGALYLDETEHDFTLTLPSAIGSGDFTLQFRYYQSHTEVPKLDSYVMYGSTKVLQFNGSQILDSSGTALSSMPIGTWNEIAIIRSDGISYFYLNGVSIGNPFTSVGVGRYITFHFGSEQQTYKELDELRILNYALVTGGSNYTPTSVPHDTNLALVLPDGAVPVADEYIEISGDGDLFHFDFSNYDISNYSSVRDPEDMKLPAIVADGVNSTVRIIDGVAEFIVNSDSATGFLFTKSFYVGTVGRTFIRNIYMPKGICIPTYSGIYSYNWEYFTAGSFDINTVYSVSLVTPYGEVYSFEFSNSLCNSGYRSIASFDWGTVYAYGTVADDQSFYGFSHGICIMPSFGNVLELSYIDIRPVAEAPLSVEKISSVTLMDSASLHTPTLAVRSDIPVTNYQIGGVRPSIPYKGLVYAMVESGYITSLQIYDGRAWVACDGRIWTGERWIPYSSYNVVTLSDMYDIADASGNSGYEYIYSESGFWSWFQKQWLSFREWCERVYLLLSRLVSDSGSSGSGDESGGGGLLSKFGELLGKLVGGLIGGIKAIIGKLFDLLISLMELVGERLDALVEMITSWFETLPESFGGVVALLSALFALIPDELTVVLLLALAGLVFIGILKAIRR